MDSDHKLKNVKPPESRIISDSSAALLSHRDTLNNVANVIALLQELNLSAGLPIHAENGLYLIQATLIDTVKYVSDSLSNGV